MGKKRKIQRKGEGAQGAVGEKLIVGATVLVLAILIFARLGHYALWDDESLTALTAKGVLRTGDTSIQLDHGNIVAYRAGFIVRNMCDRSTPPLPIYATAVSFALFGVHAWAARLPFALAGLWTAALMLLWARREPWPLLPVVALGLIGNVSLILFCRQCRYYGAAILFSTAAIFIYARAKPTTRNLFALAGVSILLFACQYLDYLALYACLAVDYLVWKRKEWAPSWHGALCWFGPQIVCNGIVGLIWNPLWTPFGSFEAHSGLFDRLTLVYWYWRDMDYAEFAALPLIVLALVLGIVWRRVTLVRGCVALAIFVTTTSLICPQVVKITSVADIRYIVPVIPLAIALEAGAICALLGRVPWLAIVAAVVIFGTNFFNGGLFFETGLRSTLACYIGELLHPVPEPYTPASDWINANVPEGESVWVLPDYATYPLMFRAPRALYAWQLDWPPRPDFAGLPRIQFKGQEPPDYLIAFGPSLGQMAQALGSWNRPDVKYKMVGTINTFWRDMYRPELFWRTFTPIVGFDPQSQAIYIFQRAQPPIQPGR